MELYIYLLLMGGIFVTVHDSSSSKNFTFITETAEQALLLAIESQLQTMWLNTNDMEVSSIPIEDTNTTINIDYDPIEGRVYWTDEFDFGNIVQSAFLNGSDTQMLDINEIPEQTGIVVDRIGRNLYWAGGGLHGKIEVSRLNGKWRKSLITDDLINPHSLCVEAEKGYMWWLSRSRFSNKVNSKIERAFLDGSHREVLVDSGLVRPSVLVVDAQNNKMYWAEDRSCILRTATLEGKIQRVLTRLLGYSSCKLHGFTILGDDIYMAFTNWRKKTFVERISKHNATDRTQLLTDTQEAVTKVFMAVDLATNHIKDTGGVCGDNYGYCSHLCFPIPDTSVNTSGIIRNYTCACANGYRLDKDKISCLKDPDRLLFATVKRLQILSVSTGDITETRFPIHDMYKFVDLDYEPVGGYVYWTDIHGHDIRRSLLNGSDIQVLVDTTHTGSKGITVDNINNNLYRTDRDKGTIGVSKLNGKWPNVVITDLVSPQSLCVDAEAGYIWWVHTDRISQLQKIERAFLDGTNRDTILYEELYNVSVLTLDKKDETIYWLNNEYDQSRIEFANFDGTKRRFLAYTDDEYANGLAVTGSYVFWATHTGLGHGYFIQRLDKHTGTERTTVIEESAELITIKAFQDKTLDSPRDRSPCNENNGGCSQLCFSLPDFKTCDDVTRRRRCACAASYILGTDGHTCLESPEQTVGPRSNVAESSRYNKRLTSVLTSSKRYRKKSGGMLLTAAGKHIRMSLVKPKGVVDFTLAIDNIEQAVHVDYDPLERYVFWVENSTMELRSARIDGSDVRVLVNSGVASYGGLAIDWTGRHVFWTDSVNARIEVVRYKGDSRALLISDGLNSPRDICVDSQIGYLWWIDISAKPRIERSLLDGSHRQVIIDKGLGSPSGITVDGSEHMLYWIDPKRDIIESAKPDGTGRRIVANVDVENVNGLTILGDFLYWSDQKKTSIDRVHKTTGNDLTTIRKNVPDIFGLKASYRKPLYTGPMPCGDYGGCSDLCFPLPDAGLCSNVNRKRFCACPDKKTLNEDESTCSDDENMLLISAGVGELQDIDMDIFTNFTQASITVHKGYYIDFDPVKQHVYWIEYDMDYEEQITKRAFLNGSDERVINYFSQERHFYDDTHKIYTIDWIGRYMYWITKDTIEVQELDGNYRKTLLSGLEDLRDLSVDTENGYMFWTYDWKRIERSFLDGSQRQAVLIDKEITKIRAITVGSNEQKLYWIAVTKSGIISLEYSNYDGSDRRTFHAVDVEYAYDLTALGDYIYLVDWNRQWIQRFNRRYGGDMSTVMFQNALTEDIRYREGKGLIHGVHIRQVPKVKTACSDNNGGCQHLCFSIPHKSSNGSLTWRPKCVARTSYALNLDNVSASDTKGVLLVVESNAILTLNFSSTESEADVKEIANFANSGLHGIDYDPVEGTVYYGWQDGNFAYQIAREPLNNTGIDYYLFKKPRGDITDVVVDWIGRHLYWIDPELTQIEMIRLDGSLQKVVLYTGSKPRSLRIDVEKGFLWWIDTRSHHTIERCYIDGSRREVIVHIAMGNPVGLALDSNENKIYWCDYMHNTVEVANMDGTGRDIVIESIGASAISILGDHMYVYHEIAYYYKIERRNKHNGDTVLIRNGHSVDTLVAVDSDKIPIRKTECTDLNGGCSDFCFDMGRVSIGKRRRCACRTNFVLNSDNKTCSDKRNRFIYVTTNSSSIVRFTLSGEKVDLASQQAFPISMNQKPGVVPRSVNVDPIRDVVYWIDDKVIRRSNMDGSKNEIIVAGSSAYEIEPFNLVIDPYSQLIFWTCAKNNVINFLRTDLTASGIVVKEHPRLKPRHLAVDIYRGKLLWTNHMGKTEIYSMNYDGTYMFRTIHSIYSKNAGPITVDGASNVLCWIRTEHFSAVYYSIICSTLSGKFKRDILDRSYIKVIEMTVISNTLYWIEPSKLRGVNFNTLKHEYMTVRGSNLTILESDWLSGGVAIGSAIYKDSNISDTEHPCLSSDLNCSHICMARDRQSALCSCPFNLMLAEDKRTCVEMPANFICGNKTHYIPYADIPRGCKCNGIKEYRGEMDEMYCTPLA